MDRRDPYRPYPSPLYGSSHTRPSAASSTDARPLSASERRTESGMPYPPPGLGLTTATPLPPFLPPLQADRYGKQSLPPLTARPHDSRHAYESDYAYQQQYARGEDQRPAYDYRDRHRDWIDNHDYRREQLPPARHEYSPVQAQYTSAHVVHSARRSSDVPSSSRVSPTKGHSKRHRDDESDSSEDEKDKSKLEVKREKNRVKQRNLRLRRANHISDLESQVATLTQDKVTLETRFNALERKSHNLERYIADLEAVLTESGLDREVAALQAVWDGLDYAGRDAAGLPAINTRMPPPRPSGTANTSPKEHDDRYDPRRTTASPWGESSYKRPTSGPTSNLTDTAPSPRSLRIEDLLSPSAIDSNSPQKDQQVHTVAQAEMPDFIPLNLNFQVEPWMMEGWLHWGPPLELGDPLMSREASSDGTGDLTTVEDGTSFGEKTDPYKLAAVERRRSSQVHPCVHIARKMLRTIVPEAKQPVSEWILSSLEPVQQRVILSALSQLGNPALRQELAQHQVDTLPPGFVKVLLQYQLDPEHDLRLILLPIAILRARIIQFKGEGLDFDLTTFITHVMADARVFGDVADADAWEMSESFWDVWGGWFPLARGFCGSMKEHRRRMGHAGSTVMEIIMGEEQHGARMACLIGRPEGWKMPEAIIKQSEQSEK